MRTAQFDQSLCAFFKCVVTLPEVKVIGSAKTHSGEQIWRLVGVGVGDL